MRVSDSASRDWFSLSPEMRIKEMQYLSQEHLWFFRLTYCVHVPLKLELDKMAESDDIYTGDGTVDISKKPANKEKTGNWKACSFILEFFYDQASDSMRSMFSAFSLTSLALGSYLSTVLVTVTKITTRDENGWIPDNLNRGHLDYFFWLLAILNLLNFIVYLWIARWYTYKKVAQQSTPPLNNKFSPGSTML
ncbi:hypothetical protein V6N12_017609 [Hibiscus sabdariffa]|uniref:Uncharacterized protein n=1 Tax=Hibiscus sabdariffa TaxID=183260 RepID=A0ABR2CG15_9ROSI